MCLGHNLSVHRRKPRLLKEAQRREEEQREPELKNEQKLREAAEQRALSERTAARRTRIMSYVRTATPLFFSTTEAEPLPRASRWLPSRLLTTLSPRWETSTGTGIQTLLLEAITSARFRCFLPSQRRPRPPRQTFHYRGKTAHLWIFVSTALADCGAGLCGPIKNPIR